MPRIKGMIGFLYPLFLPVKRFLLPNILHYISLGIQVLLWGWWSIYKGCPHFPNFLVSVGTKSDQESGPIAFH